ncbi:hypothetical protein EGW08_003868 [Elysia chlorotica]|uniref:Uncharacterized protein n=1 Tax=Elysia chlorotica TaxID=188477 RepID=A0A433U3H0_ELYCH|nr:hypothetical protein EGW08_003868 [Elysia chlorotica]
MSHTSSTLPPDQEVLAFNLTDPERLTTQLDAADLNDEETELLLSEALKLNARLKDVLRHQQLEPNEPRVSKNTRDASSAGKSRGTGSRGNAGRSAGSGPGRPGHHHPLEEQFLRKQAQVPGGKAKLPPIGAAGVKSRPGKGAKSDDAGRGAASNSPSSLKKRQGSGKKRQVDNRPAWDDRFSYD